MTNKPDASSAFTEAEQNLRAAEQFVDAGDLGKANAAASIASVWIQLGRAVEPTAASMPFESHAGIADRDLPAAATPKHQHGKQCAHEWVLPDGVGASVSDLPVCAYRCETSYSAATKDQPCPALCLMWAAP
jgi:hypothetical protein